MGKTSLSLLQTFVLLVGLTAGAAAGPITVQPLNPNASAAENGATLANALFAGTPGITVTNVTYDGIAQATGTFAGGGDNVGIETGVVMTSGNVANVIGPNDDDGATGSNGAPGSALLNTLVSGGTNDASTLTLTFIPEGQTLQFSYVFGSEEYNEFVNAGFNDVFGFFVNGTNRAVIPGTSTPVSIDNVNNGNNAGVGTGPCVNCAFYRDNVQGGLDTQLDGLTTVLSFVAPVNPGVTNTLTLAIADVGDFSLDSAVFIKGGSVSSVGGSPSNPILPTLVNEDGFVFEFFVVVPTTTIFVDPIVAVGYDYIVNSGPNFQTVLLPNIGDGLFDIFDSLGNLLAGNFMFGNVFNFGAGGVSAFKVGGIEVSAGLDPSNPLAFVTGLTYVSAGLVNMSMNPITFDTDGGTGGPNPIPEPATILTFGAGLAALLRRRLTNRRH